MIFLHSKHRRYYSTLTVCYLRHLYYWFVRFVYVLNIDRVFHPKGLRYDHVYSVIDIKGKAAMYNELKDVRV